MIKITTRGFVISALMVVSRDVWGKKGHYPDVPKHVILDAKRIDGLNSEKDRLLLGKIPAQDLTNCKDLLLVRNF